MVQRPSSLQDPPTAFAGRVALFPTPQAPSVPAEIPAAVPPQSTGRAATAQKLRSRVIRDVVVLEVAGRLSEVVQDLDRAIQLALTDGPRGVVCDLSNGLVEADLEAVELLATAGRHVRDWPGIHIAVACPDPRVRNALAAHPLGRLLILTGALFSAVSEVLATPVLAVERLRLAPHPTAPRASREFVTRTLLGWRLGRVVPFATLVVNELVASSCMNAGTHLDLSLVWDLGALRLTVRDHGPGLAGQPASGLVLQGRGLAVVAGLSRAFGVLPTDDGGKLVWAVLEAARPRPSVRGVRPGRETGSQSSPVFIDGRSMADLPLCAASSRPPTSDVFGPSQGRDRTYAR